MAQGQRRTSKKAKKVQQKVTFVALYILDVFNIYCIVIRLLT